MRAYYAVLTILLAGFALGCISPPPEMNVTVDVLEETFEVTETGGKLILTVTAEVSVRNDGDPGHATILSTVWDELDDEFAKKSEKIHLDSGESKELTFVLQGEVTEDADIEAYYNIVKVDVAEPD
jgi:hypothetical protein